MASIEETELDVPLYRVAEHIVGKLHHLIASRRTAKIAAWESALGELLATVRAGKLKVRGFRGGSSTSERTPPIEFAEIANNPAADFSFDIEYSGKLVLEFDSDFHAKILETHFSGPPTLLWRRICADSGAEVLKCWPPKPHASEPAPPNLTEILTRAIARELTQDGTPLSQRKAKRIASNAGALESDSKVIAVLKTLQDNPDPGPRRGKKRKKANN